jgi:hypothetical protein
MLPRGRSGTIERTWQQLKLHRVLSRTGLGAAAINFISSTCYPCSFL